MADEAEELIGSPSPLQLRSEELYALRGAAGNDSKLTSREFEMQVVAFLFQCRHFILFDQQYIGEGGFLSAAGNGAVQNNF